MNQLINKSICKCGAITLTFDNGAINSMRSETFDSLPQQYHILNNNPTHKTYCCNNCVNGWGVESDSWGEVQELEVCMPIGFKCCGGDMFPRTLHETIENIELFESGEYDNRIIEQWYSENGWFDSVISYILERFNTEWGYLSHKQKLEVYNAYN